MISKELLSEILEDNIKRIGSFNYPILEVEHIRYSYNEWIKWNIHELTHLCKEWAFKNNRVLQSQLTNSNEGVIGYCYINNLNSKNIDNLVDHYASTEQQAVFDACQWILENKEKIR